MITHNTEESPRKPLDCSDMAYAASALDCEGCISIFRVKNKNRIGETYYTYGSKIIVGNTNRILTDWLYSKFGGILQIRLTKGNDKNCYLWSLTRKADVAYFIKTVLPYLKMKKDQAQLMLDYHELYQINAPAVRNSFRERMMSLNRKGKSVTTNTQDLPVKVRVVKIEPEHFVDEVSAPIVKSVA